ncbi:multidrug ABC transporter ATP-binding protein [Alkalilimnicola ehrlichii]|uniref:Multidrug ABC transporter ATP-binding protein n=2 Tax=Alkalilimnicola ehrlichii TaxID=351052 RepID=A0A3E0WN80_9GAMM|nr:ABC transporter ATP-binding protein [Alkalilimnicola ehrlichii]RFA26374.1 multidrug ABC transporter ATP-binding protein [Alkalilimnicola ehrlichii]RFA33436.1 multidrug ABC transporter ATP-binding protein [Alkalilimnicola ehrlichii]
MKLVIENLSKTYPNGTQALKHINLEIGKGMFGLLGQNGAGKSTLIRTIATLQDPDSGSIRFGDIDVLKQPNELRKVLGYLPQEFGAHPALTAEEMLDQIADLKGIANRAVRRETVAYLLDKVNLYEVRKKRLGGYSGGMKQRLGIAQALLGAPRLIVVDEPTAGLDPLERNRFYNLLAEIGEHVTVLLSTHIVDDVRALCSEMAIIGDGKLLAKDTPSALEDWLAGKLWERAIDKDELDHYRRRHHVISYHLRAGRMFITVFAPSPPGAGFAPKTATLQDVYFWITTPREEVAA